MRRLLLTLLVLLSFLTSNAQKGGQAKTMLSSNRPKLVVGIVVDQMRYDYLYRFADHFGAGGFRRFLDKGFECRNVNYDYIPTYTGPGHAAIYTGTTPYYNGIIGNDWYDKNLKRSVYVTEDTTVTAVGSSSKAGLMSPRRLLASTVTDELRLSNNSQSKVIGVCLKDRGSILPAGHLPTAAYWFDNKTGSFITSSYYTSALPAWVTAFNDQKKCDAYLSKPWTTLFPIEQYTMGLPNGSLYRNAYKGETANQFPHDLPAIKEKMGYELIRSTPFGNSLTIDFALETLDQEHMGQGKYTDFLALSLSSTDYIGHQFGINAIETQDTYARLDKDLARLFDHLDQTVGLDNVLIFLTADHGAAQTPEQMKALGVPGGIFISSKLKDNLNTLLATTYSQENLVLHYNNQQIWLNEKVIQDQHLNRTEVIQKCAQYISGLEGVQEVYNISEVGQWKPSELHTQRLLNGVHPARSGALAFTLQPGWFDGEHMATGGTTHGSGFSYDTHVPLLWLGWHIKNGSTSAPQKITDIAITLSDLLHISSPNAAVGTSMTEVISK